MACRYLQEVGNRLFSEGLHLFGQVPTPDGLSQYLSAYIGTQLPEDVIDSIARTPSHDLPSLRQALELRYALPAAQREGVEGGVGRGDGGLGVIKEGFRVRELLEENTQELTSFLRALNGEYVLPEAGGDLLRDGPGVLPTGALLLELLLLHVPSCWRCMLPPLYANGSDNAVSAVVSPLRCDNIVIRQARRCCAAIASRSLCEVTMLLLLTLTRLCFSCFRRSTVQQNRLTRCSIRGALRRAVVGCRSTKVSVC